MRRDFCDIRVNILFEQGTLHPGQRFAFFTETLLACELHLLFQDADTVLKFCILSHDFLHHGNCQSAKLFRVTGGTEKRDIHAVDYMTSRMDIHYISLSYCVALSIFGFLLVYPFCQVMPFHLLPVNPKDQPVKLILCEMPCGITFPGPAEASRCSRRVHSHTPCLSHRRTFMRERTLLVKTKAAPSCHAALSSFWTYCVSVSIPRRISTGFTTRNTLSGVSMAKSPENIG